MTSAYPNAHYPSPASGTWESGSYATDDPALFDWISQKGADPFQRPTSEQQALILSGTTLYFSNVNTAYDDAGHMTWRSYWTSGTENPRQTLTWDARGRLVKVSQRKYIWNGNNVTYTGDGDDWSAVYDGLGRRLRTVKQNIVSGTNSGAAQVIDSYYDPQVEFQEVGISIDGTRTWKIYGPDLNGRYGALQGTGGLEATVTSGTVTPVVNDVFGNVVGTINTSNHAMVWSPCRIGSYGILPDSPEAPLLDGTNVTLAQATVWRSHRIDPTGFYYMGARYYEPNSGRFISPDPLGHAASMSLYDYCNGDPVNGLDPDGRCMEKAGQSINHGFNWVGQQAGNLIPGMSGAAVDNTFRTFGVGFAQLSRTLGSALSPLGGDMNTLNPFSGSFFAYQTVNNALRTADVFAGLPVSAIDGDLYIRQRPVQAGSQGIMTAGVLTSYAIGRGYAEQIQDQTGVALTPIANGSSIIGDFIQIAAEELGIITMPSIQAYNAMMQLGGGYEVAHSQGAMVTYNADRLLPYDVRQNTYAVTFGGQRSLDAGFLGLGYAENWTDRRDFVPSASPMNGALRMLNGTSLHVTNPASPQWTPADAFSILKYHSFGDNYMNYLHF